MAQLIQLRRHETGTSWGFRLNGGLEYGQPLYIKKVTARSLALQSGLSAGDVVLQINGIPTAGMRHDNAKMEIIRAGNEVDFYVQKGGITGHVDGPMQQCKPEVLEEPSEWEGIPAQNANVQSKSFEILQHQMKLEGEMQ